MVDANQAAAYLNDVVRGRIFSLGRYMSRIPTGPFALESQHQNEGIQSEDSRFGKPPTTLFLFRNHVSTIMLTYQSNGGKEWEPARLVVTNKGQVFELVWQQKSWQPYQPTRS